MHVMYGNTRETHQHDLINHKYKRRGRSTVNGICMLDGDGFVFHLVYTCDF